MLEEKRGATVTGKLLPRLGLALLVLVLLFVLALFAFNWPAARRTPRVVLPDGSSAAVASVTYGTNHVIGTPLGRMISKLPTGIQDGLGRLLGRALPTAQTLTTTEPELVVWLERWTNGMNSTFGATAYYEAFLADGSNCVSGPSAYISSWLPGSRVEPIQFKAFPRRAPTIGFHIYHHPQNSAVTECSSFSFPNPFCRSYPEWTPETLPAVKRVDDLEASLLRIETGHGSEMTHRARGGGGTDVSFGTNLVDGRNCTVVDLRFRSRKNTNEVWRVAEVESSDATGNTLHSQGMTWGSPNEPFSFSPSLWPNENAWKFKFHAKRDRGFRPDELITFTKVPLGELNQTNGVGWSTNLNGVTVTLQELWRRQPMTNGSWSSSDLSGVRFKNSALPKGMYLDLVETRFTPGTTVQTGSSQSSDNERSYEFLEIALSATNGDFILALQRDRTIEFTVKPELPGLSRDARP